MQAKAVFGCLGLGCVAVLRTCVEDGALGLVPPRLNSDLDVLAA